MASATAAAANGDTRRRLGWAPYALLAPSLVYLAVFFALPMINAFGLAFQGDAGGSAWSRSGGCSGTGGSVTP